MKGRRGKTDKIKVPEGFAIEDIEDAYTYYVLILEIPETDFWHCSIAFLEEVAANKAAFDAYVAAERDRLSEER